MTADPQAKPVTGAEVAEQAVEDFHSFYHPAAGFQLRLGFNGITIARCVGIGPSGGIVMSEDFKSQPVDSLEELAFVLLILGHEVAHYVHLHNAVNQLPAVDNRSLEDWADFYGAKVMMTLMAYGARTGPLFQRLRGTANVDEVYVKIGNALARLAHSVFPTYSSSYSTPLTRVGNCVCGILSFVDALHETKDLKRSLEIQQLLYSNPVLHRLIIDQGQAYLTDDMPARSLAIHRGLQPTRAGITPGLQLELERFLRTSFDNDDDSIARNAEAALAELVRQGLQV